MLKVVMYKKAYCPYCRWATNLLNKKNIPFEEIDITNDEKLQEYVVEKSGKMTVPQIFINDIPIGGYTELSQLDASGALDKLLEKESTEENKVDEPKL